VNSARHFRAASTLALCLWGCGVTSRAAEPAAPTPPPTTPSTPALASAPPISDPSAWDEPRPIPSTGLTLGPPCDDDATCEAYTSDCIGGAMCLRRQGRQWGICKLGTRWGGTCGEGSSAEPGICRLGVCQPGSVRPRTCGELVVLKLASLRGKRPNFASGCPNEQCVEKRRAEVAALASTLGSYFSRCLVGGDVGASVRVEWDPTAPYATPVPGLPARRQPAAAPAEAKPPDNSEVPP
jgi:hypothetical protein